MNNWKRRAPAVLAVLLLSVPSAIGVQHALAPTRGVVASWMGAAGFEAVYLSTAILVLSTDLRRYAQRIALAAVLTAVVLNTIADYAARVRGGLSTAALAWSRFDGLALSISLIESLPLAGLSFAMASLLHRIAEQGAVSLATDLSNSRELLRAATADLARVRGELAQLQAASAQPDPLLAQQAADLAQFDTTVAQLQDELARREEILAQRARRIAQLEEQAAQPLSIDGIDVLAVARRLRTAGASSRETADLLRVPESTLRNRLKETNGRAVEV